MKIDFTCETKSELDAVLAFVDFLTEGETPRCVSVADITILPRNPETEKKEAKPCKRVCPVRGIFYDIPPYERKPGDPV